jgi:hypothetical protein
VFLICPEEGVYLAKGVAVQIAHFTPPDTEIPLIFCLRVGEMSWCTSAGERSLDKIDAAPPTLRTNSGKALTQGGHMTAAIRSKWQVGVLHGQLCHKEYMTEIIIKSFRKKV